MPPIPSASRVPNRNKSTHDKRVSLRKPTALGVDIFAGGFSLGVRRYFDVMGHLEEGNYGVETVRYNWPDFPVTVGVENWPKQLARPVDFLYGNPPCAAWSSSGFKKGQGNDKWKTDPRIDCTSRHFGLIERYHPKVWVWESVTRAYTTGYEFVVNLTRQAAALGYSTTYVLHNARWLGVPQIRKRFFMVCHRVNLEIPVPRFDPPPCPYEVIQNVGQNGEPLYDKLMGPTLEYQQRCIEAMQPGDQARKVWDRLFLEESIRKTDWPRTKAGFTIGRPSFGTRRLPIGRPMGAFVGYPVIHPIEHRSLSIEEIAALCGFPPDYYIVGKGCERGRKLARGVCPPVAVWIAGCVRRAIDHDRPVHRPTVTYVDIQDPPGHYVDCTEQLCQ